MVHGVGANEVASVRRSTNLGPGWATVPAGIATTTVSPSWALSGNSSKLAVSPDAVCVLQFSRLFSGPA